jgi:hypothetical protein
MQGDKAGVDMGYRNWELRFSNPVAIAISVPIPMGPERSLHAV